ncbi:MAG: hypothetical protein JO030_03130, partial [Candidatus Eremiobacteraeota bacterium]|nr:hypothetical protein [Candidatus Eremiobacteraeota bacterium]
MRLSPASAAFGAALIAVFFFFFGFAARQQAAIASPDPKPSRDGNPIGFHLKGQAKIDVPNLTQCNGKAGCYLTLDVYMDST